MIFRGRYNYEGEERPARPLFSGDEPVFVFDWYGVLGESKCQEGLVEQRLVEGAEWIFRKALSGGRVVVWSTHPTFLNSFDYDPFNRFDQGVAGLNYNYLTKKRGPYAPVDIVKDLSVLVPVNKLHNVAAFEDDNWFSPSGDHIIKIGNGMGLEGAFEMAERRIGALV